VFGVGAATRIYLAPGVTDMRMGFNGLYGLVRDQLLCDPLSGHLFLFSNAHRNRLKILFWDTTAIASRWRRVESCQRTIAGSSRHIELNFSSATETR